VLIAHGFVAKVARAVFGAGFDDFFEWQLASGTVCGLTLTAYPSIERTSTGELRIALADRCKSNEAETLTSQETRTSYNGHAGVVLSVGYVEVTSQAESRCDR